MQPCVVEWHITKLVLYCHINQLSVITVQMQTRLQTRFKHGSRVAGRGRWSSEYYYSRARVQIGRRQGTGVQARWSWCRRTGLWWRQTKISARSQPWCYEALLGWKKLTGIMNKPGWWSNHAGRSRRLKTMPTQRGYRQEINTSTGLHSFPVSMKPEWKIQA